MSLEERWNKLPYTLFLRNHWFYLHNWENFKNQIMSESQPIKFLYPKVFPALILHSAYIFSYTIFLYFHNRVTRFLVSRPLVDKRENSAHAKESKDLKLYYIWVWIKFQTNIIQKSSKNVLLRFSIYTIYTYTISL